MVFASSVLTHPRSVPATAGSDLLRFHCPSCSLILGGHKMAKKSCVEAMTKAELLILVRKLNGDFEDAHLSDRL